MSKFRTTLFKISVVVLPIIIVVALTIVEIHRTISSYDPKPSSLIPGKPLAAYSSIYPVEVDPVSGTLTLNVEKFMAAVDRLSDGSSPKAISDLIYLGQGNNISLQLNESDRDKYSELIQMKAYKRFHGISDEEAEELQTYKQIVDGIGETFRGAPIEIVLHDARNPTRSIVALQNPISGRKLGDPNSNFGVELIKHYSTVDPNGDSFVSYPQTLRDGRAIKSTTIPIFDKRFGLIALMCINIDVSRLKSKDPAAVAKLINSLAQVYSQQRVSEIIDTSRKN